MTQLVLNDSPPSEGELVPSLIAEGLPHTHLRHASDLPWITFMEGLELQLLHANVETGLWVVQTRFAPGMTLPAHKHTGEVFAVTFSGAWKYLEYPEVNIKGSYLYEPAGTVHTLHSLSSNTEVTEVWFAIRGANLNLDAAGNVESVWDARFMLDIYNDLCRQAGHPVPDVIRA